MAAESVERLLASLDRPLAPSPEFAAALRQKGFAGEQRREHDHCQDERDFLNG